jgi:hypothetical protein
MLLICSTLNKDCPYYRTYKALCMCFILYPTLLVTNDKSMRLAHFGSPWHLPRTIWPTTLGMKWTSVSYVVLHTTCTKDNIKDAWQLSTPVPHFMNVGTVQAQSVLYTSPLHFTARKWTLYSYVLLHIRNPPLSRTQNKNTILLPNLSDRTNPRFQTLRSTNSVCRNTLPKEHFVEDYRPLPSLWLRNK